MQTVLEILKKTTDFFASKGIAEARFDAESLLAHGLNIGRMDLYLQFDRPLSEAEITHLRPLVARRGKREPLQHIIGEVGFRHLLLKSDARALIPRPDTEMIVDLVLEKALPEHHILDIGTGTGAIILSLCSEKPQIQGYGLDISPEALNLAQENAKLNQIQNVQWIQSNLFTNLPVHIQFDIIVSNPPYIQSKVCLELEPEVKDFDPLLALDGGESGLEIYDAILAQAKKHLKSQGYLIFEIGYDQNQDLINLGEKYGWIWIQSVKDYGGNDRFVVFKNP